MNPIQPTPRYAARLAACLAMLALAAGFRAFPDSPNQPPTAVWAPGNPTFGEAPGYFRFAATLADPDGTVVAAEVTDHGQVVATIAPGDPSWLLYVAKDSTNDFRIVVHDDHGATGTSDIFRFVGREAPVIVWTVPTNLVVPAGEPFDVTVDATSKGGTIQRVEFNLTSGSDTVVRIADQPPWQVTFPGISVDGRLTATAHDDSGFSRATETRVVHPAIEGDDFFRPFPLIGSPVADARSNANATTQFGDPPGASATIWWRWTAPSNGIVTVTSLGSSGATYLAIGTGGNTQPKLLASTNSTPGFEPNSRIDFRAVAGTTYRFVVGASSIHAHGVPSTAAIRLSYIDPFVAPPNDLYARRALIPTPSAAVSADTTMATREPSEAWIISTNSGSGGHSVWWEWVAPAAGTATFSTAGSSFDTLLGVYGSFVGATNLPRGLLGASDDVSHSDTSSLVVLKVGTGDRYAIAVDGYYGDSGTVRLSVDFVSTDLPAKPANDDFASATPIGGLLASIRGTASGASREPDEPTDTGGLTTWWSWPSPTNSRAYVTIETASAYATVWTGDSPGALTLVGGSTFIGGKKAAVFDAVAGRTYRICIASTLPNKYAATLNSESPPVHDRSLKIVRMPGSSPMIGCVGGVTSFHGVLQTSTNLVDWTDAGARIWYSGVLELLSPEGPEAIYYRLSLDR